MVNEEVVEGVMRSALTSISKKDKISLKDLRIKMQLNDAQNSVNCAIMNGKEWKYMHTSLDNKGMSLITPLFCMQAWV